MAVMIPTIVAYDTSSDGEMRLFERFRDNLSDSYSILHSFDIANARWCEIDFVVISPRGVFVIEVKGGSVEHKDGMWYHTNRAGRAYPPTTMSPWRQAKNNLFALKNEIDKKYNKKKIVFGYGLVLPDENKIPDSPEVDRNTVLLKSHWNDSIHDYLLNLEDYWVSSLCDEECSYYSNSRCVEFGNFSQCPRRIDRKEREKLVSILRPDSQTTYTLKSKLNHLEEKLIELTNEQVESVRLIEDNPRTIIEGGTGTGKTIIALNQAIKHAEDGNRVLFLCYNEMLAAHLIENIPAWLRENEILKVNYLHGYMREVIESKGEYDLLNRTDLTADERFKYLYPEVYCNTMENCDDYSLFDTVFIDEAQDLLTPEYMNAISMSLKGGIQDGQWHLFMDPNQNIFNIDNQETWEQILELRPARKKLTVNCRNCRTVAQSVIDVSGIAIPLEKTVLGGISKSILYKDKTEFYELLTREVTDLLEQGLSCNEFIILSMNTKAKSLLSDTTEISGMPLIDIKRNDDVEHSIHFCTMHSFKGLERKAVIAVDVEPPWDENDHYKSRLLYTGLSRALTYLTVLQKKS